jgi:hypothetical protein
MHLGKKDTTPIQVGRLCRSSVEASHIGRLLVSPKKDNASLGYHVK